MWSRQTGKGRFAALLWTTLALGHAPEGVAMQVDGTPAAKTLVILGASYAKGWGTPPLPGFKVVNRGVGGEETKDMAARFQRDVVAGKPDAVLIWGHVNNITRSAPDRLPTVKAEARSHYVEMIRLAREADIDVILATEIPWTEQSGWINEARALIGRLRGKQSYAERVTADVGELNDFVRQLATKERLRVLDFEQLFATEDGTRKPEFAAEDGSHISAAGYQALTAYAVKQFQTWR